MMTMTISLENILEPGKPRSEVTRSIKSGKILIYPTDTVYGLGCNALNAESVAKIREIKKSSQPFSVIAPSKAWMRENLAIRFPAYMQKLPGPYTLILEMKKQLVPEIVSVKNLGVRIPDHPFTKIIQESCVPFITTSCNLHGKETIREVGKIPEEITRKVDIIIEGGRLNNPPSQVIDLTGDKTKVLRK